MIGIYKIESPSGHFYIGSSTNTRRRLNTHKRELRNMSHINSALRNAASKYGVDSLLFTEYFCVFNGKDLRAVEQELIDGLKPQYNISKVAACALFDQDVISKRVASKRKQVVRLTDGFVFQSGADAARHHGIKNADNLCTAIKNGWMFAGHFWKYENQDVDLEKLKFDWQNKDKQRKQRAKSRAALALGKPVRRLSDGAVFPNATAASIAMGCYKKMVSEAICKGVEKAGSRWEYV